MRELMLTYGTDPELFLSRGGKVIGSEKVIPEGGLPGKVVRDGVQVELNPHSATTTRGLGLNITTALNTLVVHLRSHPDVSLDWSGVVEVDRAELDSLCPENQELGCQPSENVYGEKPITVDGRAYRMRSAGGHAHFGGLPYTIWGGYDGANDIRNKVIPPFDIIIGNSLVMLDRDPNQKERRENYGRAGEYRRQPHGVEYRTPSNLWMRGYPLMSFVFGMGHFCVELVNDTAQGGRIEQELIEAVKIDNFIEAIDTNNFDLAKRNFISIVPFLRNHLPASRFPLNPKNLDSFLLFADAVAEHGIERYFPEAPHTHWVGAAEKLEFADFLAKLFKVG